MSAVAVRHCPNPDCPFARQRGRPAEYRAGVERCSDCAGALADGPPAPEASPGRLTAGTAGRLLVTIAAPIAMLALSAVPLPGADARLGQALGSGFRPLIEAFLFVELAAWVVPPWRALRDGPRGRAILSLLALGLALALSALQGLNAGLMLARYAHAPPWTPVLMSAYLTIGTLALWALSLLVDRTGLGGGFALLLVVAMGGREVEWVLHSVRENELAPGPVAMLFGMYGALAAVTLWLIRSRRAEPVREPAPGVLAALGASWLAAAIWLAGLLGESWLGTRRFSFLAPDRTPYLTVEIVAAIVLAIAIGFALHRGAPRAKLRPAILRGVLFSVLLLLAPAFVTLSSGLDRLPAGVVVAFAAALWEDLRRELAARRRDPSLVPAWPVVSSSAASVAQVRLREAGIDAFPRGEAVHALLHLFGPFLPISLLVPAARAEDAKRVLTAALPPSAAS